MDEIPRQVSGKARILEAAVDLTAEGGVARATISAICERAGVRAPALYYHFGSKDGLVSAVLEAVATAWVDELAASVVAKKGQSLEEFLPAVLRGWRALILAPQNPVELLVRVQLERADAAPPIREALRSVMERTRAIIADMLEEIAGPLRDPHALGQTVVSLVQGAALRHHLDKDEIELDHRLAEIGDAITALVAAHQAPGATPDPALKPGRG